MKSYTNDSRYFHGLHCIFASICLVSITGCQKHATEPVACFSANVNIANVLDTISFNNCSVDADSFIWKFGDGYISRENNPAHSYSYSGNYLVELFALQSDTIVNSTSQTISITGFAPTTVYGFYKGSNICNVTEQLRIMVLFSCSCPEQLKFKIHYYFGSMVADAIATGDTFNFADDDSAFYGTGYFSDKLDTIVMSYILDVTSGAPPVSCTFNGVKQ